MNNIYVFTKKELLESWRTKRLLIVLIVFLIFGIMSPLIARLTPDIISSSFGADIQIDIPDPTSVDSWTQFYKNITQIGMYIIAILFCNSVSGEVSKGSLTNLVTKGLNRSAIIVSKYLIALFQWILAIGLCFGVTAVYTLYYFPDNESPHFVQAVIPVLIFGLFFTALILLASTIARNSFEGLLIIIVCISLLYLLNLYEDIRRYNPVTLIGENMAILQGDSNLSEINWAMGASIILMILFLGFSIAIMNKKKL